MRICLVYDCLFPHTVGGAERWYRNLAERLSVDGHEVTYVTLRQWPRGTSADVAGVDVRVVGPRMGLYARGGRRRIFPPLVFGTAGSVERPAVQPAEPVVVFAGRHSPEKRAPALVPAIARARERLPELRCEIYGDGPDRAEVERRIAQAGLAGAVSVRGFA